MLVRLAHKGREIRFWRQTCWLYSKLILLNLLLTVVKIPKVYLWRRPNKVLGLLRDIGRSTQFKSSEVVVTLNILVEPIRGLVEKTADGKNWVKVLTLSNISRSAWYFLRG